MAERFRFPDIPCWETGKYYHYLKTAALFYKGAVCFRRFAG